jgi:citrate lyase subunit beta/citryl-CoA lyase/(S)-citramalyl-CoA lyase
MVSGADLVCIDLEDAVHPDRKAESRTRVLQWLHDHPRAAGDARLALRVNGVRTLDGLRDLLAVAEAASRLDVLLLPKVEAAADLHAVQAWMPPSIAAFVALVETPQAIEQAHAIAQAGGRLGALMLGGADLTAELGARLDWDGVYGARSRLVNAAKACGLQAWDVPYLDVADAAGLETETRRVIGLGFDCKTAIHPQQVAPIHAAFAPAPADLQWAQALLAALPPGGAAGAFLFQGRMVDAPVIRRARRIAELGAR